MDEELEANGPLNETEETTRTTPERPAAPRGGLSRRRLIRVSRALLAWAALLTLAFLAVAIIHDLAVSGTMPKGVTVGGAPVGGMNESEARRAVASRARALGKPVVLTFEGREFKLDPRSLGVRPDIDTTVRRAYEESTGGPVIFRAVRRLLGVPCRVDVPVQFRINSLRLKTKVVRIAKVLDRNPTSASIKITEGGPRIQASKNGIRVKVDETVGAVEKALPTPERRITVVAEQWKPQITEEDIGKIVVISLSRFTLYLYDREDYVDEYPVAVGMPQYPTPTGKFHITYKERNPTWLPTSEWAKDKRGIPQPPGPDNPLGGYWMDLGSGLGIHATPFEGSIGEQASHGCIRMTEEDARSLYNQVKVGTPVFIVP